MFYLVLGLCTVIMTFSIARYFAVKTRLVEKTINETIARKLLTSKHSAELHRLREENGIMRNLLMDMVENEASVAAVNQNISSAEKQRIVGAIGQRRREIFAEAMYTLQHSDKTGTRATNPAE
jgi:hypothetical protein